MDVNTDSESTPASISRSKSKGPTDTTVITLAHMDPWNAGWGGSGIPTLISKCPVEVFNKGGEK